MYKNLLRAMQFVFFLGSICLLQAEHIVFDLGGVLIQTDKITAFREIGAANIINYLLSQRTLYGLISQLRKRLFNFLDTVKEREIDCPLSYDEHSNRLPQCMCDWLSGTISSKSLLKLINAKTNLQDSFFNNNAERTIILAIIMMMFTPEKLCNSSAINTKGLALVRACKEAGHKVYVLSNWDPTSFSLLKERFHELFDLFDGIVISGDHGFMKPEYELYDQLLDQYSLDPEQTIFIDDRPENIETATNLGITSILCTPEKTITFDSIYDDINNWIQSRRRSYS